jgi:hypothetical protein
VPLAYDLLVESEDAMSQEEHSDPAYKIEPTGCSRAGRLWIVAIMFILVLVVVIIAFTR